MPGHLTVRNGKPDWQSAPEDVGAERSNSGYTAVLPKPFCPDQLLDRIERVVAGRGGFAPRR